MQTPLISVVLPFFQEKQELNVSIESVLNQSFTSFELILVGNNASQIASSIAQSWRKKDKRIVLLKEEKQGIVYALNAGISHARGKYIARMDGDDRSLPQRLEKQVFFLENNQQYDVVSCQTKFGSTIHESRGYGLFVEWQNSIITNEQHQLYRFIESPLAHPSVMFRKTLVDKHGLYSTDDIPEDYELWLRWMENGVSFYKLPEVLIEWNDHQKRLSRNHSNYSKEAFNFVRSNYLTRWIKKEVHASKKIIVCGSSKICRKRAALLQKNGIEISGFTDVSLRRQKQADVIHYEELTKAEDWFLINFISKRGVGDAIRKYFTTKGFVEGIDFIMAG